MYCLQLRVYNVQYHCDSLCYSYCMVAIMIDNLPNPRAEPESEVWLSIIVPMATVHQLFYIPPLIGQWLLSIETNRLHRNNTKLELSRAHTLSAQHDFLLLLCTKLHELQIPGIAIF